MKKGPYKFISISMLLCLLLFFSMISCNKEANTVPEESKKAPEIKEKRSYKWGYIDKDGNWEIEPQLDVASRFSEGLAAVLIDHEYGYIDKSGELVIEPQFIKAGDFSEGLALVMVDNKFGYIDKSGEIVIERQFIEADDFSDGLALICISHELPGQCPRPFRPPARP